MSYNQVAPGQIAMIKNPYHKDNLNRVCQVLNAIPPGPGDDPCDIWWLCEFSRPVRTLHGWMYFACIMDHNLICIGLAAPRMHYPKHHYDLLPSLAHCSSPREAAA